MISALIHTYNEEKNIERALSSLSFADEIVLVDMGSNDNTCKIASQFTPRIFQHPHTGFVEPARNFGISKARGNWVLIIDADEEISNGLARYLRLEIQHPKADFYRIPRKNIIFGKWMKHAGWWPDYQVRFFKKENVSWRNQIHGVPLTRGTGLEIEPSENLSIIHHNYQTIGQYIDRLNRYTSISAKQLFLSNTRFSMSQLFAMQVKEFVNRFFVWEGYKDGVHGLALSILQSLSESVTSLKLWELEGFKQEKIELTEIEKYLADDFRNKQYWLINALLRQPKDLFTRIRLRIMRKLHIYG